MGEWLTFLIMIGKGPFTGWTMSCLRFLALTAPLVALACEDPCATETNDLLLEAAATEEDAVRTESGLIFLSIREVPGWTEGLQMVKGGGKAKLTLPPHLAYGSKGRPGKIPPCSVLVFEVELLGMYN